MKPCSKTQRACENIHGFLHSQVTVISLIPEFVIEAFAIYIDYSNQRTAIAASKMRWIVEINNCINANEDKATV